MAFAHRASSSAHGQSPRTSTTSSSASTRTPNSSRTPSFPASGSMGPMAAPTRGPTYARRCRLRATCASISISHRRPTSLSCSLQSEALIRRSIPRSGRSSWGPLGGARCNLLTSGRCNRWGVTVLPTLSFGRIAHTLFLGYLRDEGSSEDDWKAWLARLPVRRRAEFEAEPSRRGALEEKRSTHAEGATDDVARRPGSLYCSRLDSERSSDESLRACRPCGKSRAALARR